MPFKKKPPAKSVKKRGPMDADDHRRLASMHHAKGSLHNAKAELLEVQSGKKNRGPGMY